MNAPGDLNGLIPFLAEHMLCVGALDAEVESINAHMVRLWATCATCEARYERRFTPSSQSPLP
jgi:hypothetical protein